MKKILSYSFILIMIMAGLVKCNKIEDDPGPTGADTTITDEERIQILGSCENKARELNNLEAAEDRLEFLAWLFTQPAFSNAGFADEDLYAVFKDGRVVLFANTPVADSLGRRESTGGKKGDKNVEQIPSNGRVDGLPKTKKVSLYNGMGKVFSDNTVAIESIFAEANTQYQVDMKVASIENLKRVSGDAVFYISTHGGAGTIPRQNRPAIELMSLWTTDPVDIAREILYKQDLDEAKLCYVLGTWDTHEPVSHYGITYSFIDKYMSFGENCLIYIDACNSFSETIPRAPEFRAKIMAKADNRKATYIGWSKSPYDFTTNAASQFIFDRLLAANTGGYESTTLPKEDPRQRPFDLDAVFADLHSRGMDIDSRTGSQLMYQSTDRDEILLRPSIESLEVDEYSSTLIINGLFGTDDGKVTVNGVAVNVIAWSSQTIACIIPETGDGSAGDVVVSVRDQKSNAVPLTEWLIKLNYSSDDNGITMQGVCNLRLRADVHPRRSMPHETPTRPTLPDYSPSNGSMFNKKGSSATYSISGRKFEQCAKNGCVFLITEGPTPKTGTLPFNLATADVPLVFALYNWGPELKKIKINFLVINPPEIQETVEIRINCPDLPSTEELAESPYRASFLVPPGETNDFIEFEIADNYNIRPGNYKQSVARPWGNCSSAGKYNVNVTWNVVQPQFAPTDKTPARVASTAGIDN